MLEDGIVLARESSTEPVVSLRIEAFEERAFKDLLERCLTNLWEAEKLLLRQLRGAGEEKA